MYGIRLRFAFSAEQFRILSLLASVLHRNIYDHFALTFALCDKRLAVWHRDIDMNMCEQMNNKRRTPHSTQRLLFQFDCDVDVEEYLLVIYIQCQSTSTASVELVCYLR